MSAAKEQSWTLTDVAMGHAEKAPWAMGPGDAKVELSVLRGGLTEGVRVLTVDVGTVRATILPDRGMGLHRVQAGDLTLGWRSPVQGPVNPAFVPVAEPSGIGWLWGFDEFLVRCGLESNGAPEFDEAGRVKYPLHGRIANLPCHQLSVAYDEQTTELIVRGEVDEVRPLLRKLRLRTEYRFRHGSSEIKVRDEIVNLSANPAEAQMLYHINFGPPLGAPGSTLHFPAAKLAPRDARAAGDVPTWDQYPAAQAGFAEQVHFAVPLTDDQGNALAALRNAAGDRGAAVRWNAKTLPCFTLWKNAEALEDGYVTGLEPGTNYPNPRSVEGKAGRVAKLPPGGSVRFDLSIEALGSAAAVREVAAEAAALQARQALQASPMPLPEWSK